MVGRQVPGGRGTGYVRTTHTSQKGLLSFENLQKFHEKKRGINPVKIFFFMGFRKQLFFMA